ncbi:MAG: ECF transporter S component [Candidatus Methanomethyliaceae archaeon]|nr:ECF transporter S component [Candidatus Methanomethyliaceae archaeon]MDW7970523.1 hypothetical protein [Nitrososphaerota archaeon]
MRGRDIAIIAAFSSIYAVISLIPGFQVIGVPGTDIRISRALEAIYGAMLGPFIGPLAAFIGALVGRFLAGGGFGMLFTPLALISSFIAACIAWRNDRKIPSIIFSVLIITWYILVGREIPLYAIPHILGLLIIILFGSKIYELLNSRDKGRLFLGLLLLSYPSTMAGHMMGNIIFFIFINPSPTLFLTTLPLTIIERSIITLISASLGVPILTIAKRIFPIQQ